MGEGRKGQGTRKALVMLQVALSVILLICSGLMIRTFRAMMKVSPGLTSLKLSKHSASIFQKLRSRIPPRACDSHGRGDYAEG